MCMSQKSEYSNLVSHCKCCGRNTVLFWEIWQIKWHFLFERGEQQNFSETCNAGDTQVRQLLSWHSTVSQIYGLSLVYSSERKKRYCLHSKYYKCVHADFQINITRFTNEFSPHARTSFAAIIETSREPKSCVVKQLEVLLQLMPKKVQVTPSFGWILNWKLALSIYHEVGIPH